MNELALRLVGDAIAKGVMIATAESCTGGLVSAAITSIAGSSAMFDRGFVTYSNEAKAELLGVSPYLIQTHGAVSAEVAMAMAEGAIKIQKRFSAYQLRALQAPPVGPSKNLWDLCILQPLSKAKTPSILKNGLVRFQETRSATPLFMRPFKRFYHVCHRPHQREPRRHRRIF